jgi:hypothetical protein
MKFLMIVIAAALALFLLVWLGLNIQPKPFSSYPEKTPGFDYLPLPEELPVPVERFFRSVYGERVPLIETVVLTGRATIRPMFNLPLPARFIFVHNAGRDYRHYIEATFFGLPLLKVDEGYVDGKSFFESMVGNHHDDPNTNQGANLALWAEANWFPSILVTDPRVRWEPVDDNTALLYVPFEDGLEENFVVRFNPDTGLIDTMEAMRFRDAGQGQEKILWITQSLPGSTIEGTVLSAEGAAIWLDQGKPWAVFRLEEVVYNVDVSEYIYQRGPGSLAAQ